MATWTWYAVSLAGTLGFRRQYNVTHDFGILAIHLAFLLWNIWILAGIFKKKNRSRWWGLTAILPVIAIPLAALIKPKPTPAA